MTNPPNGAKLPVQYYCQRVALPAARFSDIFRFETFAEVDAEAVAAIDVYLSKFIKRTACIGCELSLVGDGAIVGALKRSPTGKRGEVLCARCSWPGRIEHVIAAPRSSPFKDPIQVRFRGLLQYHPMLVGIAAARAVYKNSSAYKKQLRKQRRRAQRKPQRSGSDSE